MADQLTPAPLPPPSELTPREAAIAFRAFVWGAEWTTADRGHPPGSHHDARFWAAADSFFPQREPHPEERYG